MTRLDRSQWLNYEVSGKWRIRFYEEKDDFVISVEHLPDCFSVLRFDQSRHSSFHADFYNNPKYEDFGVKKTFEEKVQASFEALKKYCSQGIVEYKYTGDKLDYTKVLDEIKNQILRKAVPRGVTRTLRSLSVKYVVKPRESGKRN